MIHINSSVELIAGTLEVFDKPLRTYCESTTSFLSELSQVLFKSKEIRIYPDISAFAFWCRNANLQKVKNNYNDLDIRLGRGVCFHITPSNIPVNFAFSFVFSLLAGNVNIVRIPSKYFPQVDYLCKVIDDVLKRHKEIYIRTAFIKYFRENEELSKYYSLVSDCRMIWGGDETIKKFKGFDTKPNCVDISFSDKYSICIINATKVLKSDPKEIKKLANNFYNDTFLMDQNACSSPQLICWMNDCEMGRNIFWREVYNIAKKKYNLQDSIIMDKFTKLCIDSISLNNLNSTSNIANLIYKVEFSSLPHNCEQFRGKGGYFYEYSLSSYNEILEIVNDKYQTVTYFGVDVNELIILLADQCTKGISRIVPIGKSLEIDIEWDGYDILQVLSRKIILKKVSKND